MRRSLSSAVPCTNLCECCGEALPEDAPLGFCPACLIRGGISEVRAQMGTEIRSPQLKFGDRVQGRYTVADRLGEGGFGVVYRARQTEPVRRDVALKIFNEGMGTAQVIRRIEVWKQALTCIDHPNIASIYDAGVTETGRPFIVQELVRGMPITAYANLQRLSLRERLVLVKHVCEALDHAHEKGVVHQGLRPSNILIAPNGHPKVIDFGVASVLHETLSEDATLTVEAQSIGTTSYTSPEQAVPGRQKVDVRADVWALGVLLFEILVGETPIAASELLGKSHTELSEFYQTHVPPKVSALFAKRSRVGTREAAALGASRLPNDLDWIVLKALELDPKRRYRSAGELADDLTRHLNDDPIAARPPKLTYRLWKFLKRRRLPVLLVLAMILAAIVGWAGVSINVSDSASDRVVTSMNAQAVPWGLCIRKERWRE